MHTAVLRAVRAPSFLGLLAGDNWVMLRFPNLEVPSTRPGSGQKKGKEMPTAIPPQGVTETDGTHTSSRIPLSPLAAVP